MKYGIFFRVVVIILITTSFIACEKSDDFIPNDEFPTESVDDVSLKSAHKSNGFVHGIVVDIDGMDYYLAGPKDGSDGEADVPGHYWNQAGPNKLVGKHYNTGPFGMPKWWSSDAEDGDLLYMVHAVIDTWSMEKAKSYAKKGFVHYHEFVKVDGGMLHPTKVIWLKHTAVTRFTLDGGPGAPNPMYEHEVTPGVDFDFPKNGMTPYDPHAMMH